jgi:hypothetical protein
VHVGTGRSEFDGRPVAGPHRGQFILEATGFAAHGDVSGDGYADAIFGGGPGGPHVHILSGEPLTVGERPAILAADRQLCLVKNSADRGVGRLAEKDADGDYKADVVAGSGEGSPASVRVKLGKYLTGAAKPGTFQDLSVFGGGVLPGGVFVG